jgi:hypothetical protein
MSGHASNDGGLVCGIDRVIANENDVLGGETVLVLHTNDRLTDETNLTAGHNRRAGAENARANDETPFQSDVVSVVEDLSVE